MTRETGYCGQAQPINPDSYQQGGLIVPLHGTLTNSEATAEARGILDAEAEGRLIDGEWVADLTGWSPYTSIYTAFEEHPDTGEYTARMWLVAETAGTR